MNMSKLMKVMKSKDVWKYGSAILALFCSSTAYGKYISDLNTNGSVRLLMSAINAGALFTVGEFLGERLAQSISSATAPSVEAITVEDCLKAAADDLEG